MYDSEGTLASAQHRPTAQEPRRRAKEQWPKRCSYVVRVNIRRQANYRSHTRPWCNAGNVHFHYQAHRLTAVAYKVYLAILAAAALLVFLLCRPAFLMTDLGFLSNSIARSFSSFILACSLVSAF